MSYVDELKLQINDETGAEPVVSAIYARVSTRNISQKDSCDNQIKFAREYLSNYKNVLLTPNHVYKDDGVSGKSVVGRIAYQQLMDGVKSGEIKLIVAKTCSRLFRDVTESQDFLRTLLKNNAALVTLEDNHLWDFTIHSEEMMFTFMSVIYSGTSFTQSDAGHAAQTRRIRDQKLLPRDLIQGFKWDPQKKDIIIDKETAPIIVDIFEDYVFRNETPASICKSLRQKGIKFPKRKRDEDTREPYIAYEYICERTVSNMIQNSKYLGLFTINTRTSIFIPGEESKRYKTKSEEQVTVERPDLQIIDRDLFEMAQRIRNSRIAVYEKPDKKTVQAHFQGIHLFAGKIFCPVCGKPYRYDYADRKKTTPIYRIANHRDCPNKVSRIYEHDLEEITKKALKQTIDQQEEVCITLEKTLTEIVEASQNNRDEIDRLKKQHASRENQLDNLIEQLSQDGLTEAAKNRIKTKINNITEETDKLIETIKDKEKHKLDDSYVTEKIASIRAAIADLRNFTSIDRDRILNYIERIDMPSNGDIEILLKSGQVIVTNVNNNKDFSDGDSVGKMGKQDVLY